MNSMLQNAFALVLLAVAPAFASGYHVVSKIPLPDDGGWDLLACDSRARRLSPVAGLGPPPPPTPAQPHPRPSIVPGTFAILVVAP